MKYSNAVRLMDVLYYCQIFILLLINFCRLLFGEVTTLNVYVAHLYVSVKLINCKLC